MYYKLLIVISLSLLVSLELLSQNWTTHCGNNERNGRSDLPGPQNIDSPVWSVNDATPTGLGMNIYSFGDLFVTSRVDFSPYTAIIECRSLATGELVWTSPDLGTESILFTMGFNEDAVYAHDYHSNLFYALNVTDGSVKWVSDRLSYTFSPMDGVILTCERDIIINGDLGSVDESTLCLDKETGEVVWTNSNWFAVTPNGTKAAHNDRLYMITGAINQPKQLVAVDMRTGENLYYSEALPGDGDQQEPIAVGSDGTIFFHRDGGNIFAVQDDGHAFNIHWTRTPVNMDLFVFNHCIDHDGNLLLMDNGRVYRLDKDDGSPIDSSLVNTLTTGRITISADSIVYINSTEGDYYALSYDLRTTLWSSNNYNLNYYAGPSLSKEGIMILCGAGTSIKAYKYSGLHAPVADFKASPYHIYWEESVDFTDQSSFSPTSWNWEFPGGTPSTSTDKDPQDIYYAESGVYDVSLIASNAYGSDTVIKQCYIEVELFEGIESPVSADHISIYPNPVHGTASLVSDKAAEIRIFNTTGEVVYRDVDFTMERKIDFSHFNPGIYIVTFSGDSFTRSGKIVVM